MVQVSVVPTEVVIVAGTKAKPDISTSIEVGVDVGVGDGVGIGVGTEA